jgi:hypothetical protein
MLYIMGGIEGNGICEVKTIISGDHCDYYCYTHSFWPFANESQKSLPTAASGIFVEPTQICREIKNG